MKIIITTLICIFISTQVSYTQQHIVETSSLHSTSELKNTLPNYGAILRLRNDANKYSNFALAGSNFGDPLWIENEGPTTTFFNGNIHSMSLMSNNLGTQTGLVIGNSTLSTGVTIDAVQNLLPPIETGVIVGTYQGPPSDHAGILGINRLQTSSGIGVEGRGGKIGVVGEVIVGNTGSATYYGVYGAASTTGSGTAYAIYGDGDSYFDGDITVSGTIINPSDRKLKKNIRQSKSSLMKLLSLNVYSYEYDVNSYRHMNLPTGTQTGFIAQDVEAIFPELTKTITHQKHNGISTLEQIELENEIARRRFDKDVATENLKEMKAAIANTSVDNTYENSKINAELEDNNNTSTNNLQEVDRNPSHPEYKEKINSSNNTTKEVYTGVNYTGLIPHTILSIQELNKENEDLKDRIKALELQMEILLSQIAKEK